MPAALMAAAAGDDSFVLKGATVHTMAGAEIQNGTVIVRAGKIIGVGNGDSSCHESDKGSARSLFNGLAQVIVQTKAPGQLQLVARSDGLQPATISLPAIPSDSHTLLP